jgi:hypothetical protein
MPRRKENDSTKDYYKLLFMDELFIIAKMWKQLKLPSTYE